MLKYHKVRHIEPNNLFLYYHYFSILSKCGAILEVLLAAPCLHLFWVTSGSHRLQLKTTEISQTD